MNSSHPSDTVLTGLWKAALSGKNQYAYGEVLAVLRQGDSIHVLDPDSWDSPTSTSRAAGARRYSVVWAPRILEIDGIYAPTSDVKRWVLDVESPDFQDASSEECLSIRRGVLEWDTRRTGRDRTSELSSADIDTLLRTGEVSVARTLWFGYAHNALAAATLTGLLLSLRWVGAIPRRIVRIVQQRRLDVGLCPHCKYPTDGLADIICPECGKSRNLTVEGEPVPSYKPE